MMMPEDVLQPYGGFHLVHVLASLTAGTVEFPFQVCRVHRYFDGIVYQGYTNTEAKEVCRRALESNGEIRTRRCTPLSALSRP